MGKELLYIGHSYHNKTKSNDFLVEILKKSYNVTAYDIDPYTQDYETALKSLPVNNVDVLVLFQLPIDGNLLKKYINFKKGVFFPMYDGAPSRKDRKWLRYKDFNIINFSKTLHDELTEMGLSSFYVQYFPEPIKVDSAGDEHSVFFWQRITRLNINIFRDIFMSLDIKNIHIHKAIDPEQRFVMPDYDNSIYFTYSKWSDNKNDMLKEMKKSAVYIAPRKYEGIGMSFLEAMAMGRCVIALNNPTMNEYIDDGITGILYDLNNPVLSREYDIKQIQKNALQYIEKGYANWENNKHRIIDFINEPVKINTRALKNWKFTKGEKIHFGKIFSIKNHSDKKHKIITFFGIKIKFKRSYKP